MSKFRVSLIRRAAALLAVPLLLVLVPIGSASAADGAEAWKKAQAKVEYTVYRPGYTAGLSRSFFRVYPTCSQGGDPLVQIEYGSQNGNRFIGIGQSQRWCLDVPDQHGPAGTFSVRGAKATVLGRCIPEPGECSAATRAGVRQSATTSVTMPASGGKGTTYVVVGTMGLTLAEIKKVVRSLVPVGSR